MPPSSDSCSAGTPRSSPTKRRAQRLLAGAGAAAVFGSLLLTSPPTSPLLGVAAAPAHAPLGLIGSPSRARALAPDAAHRFAYDQQDDDDGDAADLWDHAASISRAQASTASVPPASSRAKRDAYTLVKPWDDTHIAQSAAAPAGAQLRSFALPSSAGAAGLPGTGATIPVYWSADDNPSQTDSALIVLHGKLRNAAKYFHTFADILAANEGHGSATPHTAIVAPQFWSTINDADAYAPSDVAYADSNAWEAGDASTHPPAALVSSFAVLDALVDHFADKSKYPNMRYITLVGHGGGGQLVTRYAVVGQDNPAPGRLEVRYVVGDPSSGLAFSQDRPTAVDQLACPIWNSYRYGLDEYSPSVAYPLPFGGDPVQLFARFVKRDVRYVIGADDNSDASGDSTCAAQAWGGTKRQKRNQAYYKYITLLAGGSPSSVSRFYGDFPALGSIGARQSSSSSSGPGSADTVLGTGVLGSTLTDVLGLLGAADGGLLDPSSLPQSTVAQAASFRKAAAAAGGLKHKITFVAGARHNAEQVYSSKNGGQFLFDPLNSLVNGQP